MMVDHEVCMEELKKRAEMVKEVGESEEERVQQGGAGDKGGAASVAGMPVPYGTAFVTSAHFNAPSIAKKLAEDAQTKELTEVQRNYIKSLIVGMLDKACVVARLSAAPAVEAVDQRTQDPSKDKDEGETGKGTKEPPQAGRQKQKLAVGTKTE